jgi:hypothetical protein
MLVFAVFFNYLSIHTLEWGIVTHIMLTRAYIWVRIWISILDMRCLSRIQNIESKNRGNTL